MSRPFKITVGKKAPFVVIADSKSLAEKHATSLATEGLTSEARPLTEAEYKTVDFKSESFIRVAGGKDGAVVTPYAFVLGKETTYGLAASQAVAERHLAELLKEKASFSVEPLENSEYASVNWAEVQTIEAPKREPKAAGEDGDSKNQTDMGEVPGFEDKK